MGKQNIEKYSKGYALLKATFGLWHNNVFYRKVIVLGRDNINPDHHLIFAPNHQNALMDALAVIFTQKGQQIFLTRADIFKNKFIAKILYYLKMLPVYRIRDGFRSVIGNDEIFDKTIDVIRSKNGLVILPEGNHEGHRRLRQLKKGICRVAFQAEEASDFKLNIKIIPVGLEFSHYTRYRQVLTVIYGKPIEVSEYCESYRKNPEIALNELRSRLSDEMKKIIVHIDSEEDYEAIDELRTIINGRFADNIKLPKLFRDRMLIEKLNRLKVTDPLLYKKICSLSLDVKQKTEKLKTGYRLLSKKKHPLGWLLAGSLGLLATFPLFLYGNIFNLTLLQIPNLQSQKIKDKQFQSSIKFGYSLAIALILTPIILILMLVLIPTWWIAILIFLSLPFAGLFTWNYYLIALRIIGGFRIRNYFGNKNHEYLQLRKNYDELVSLVASL
ncbi:MAG: 1-acyl-sn-glycerol-3-phosphate acyltransferase [Bacteroidales bacterium]|jgi:1-acyl-sn-glycerol-3-phosphate acyltransferase|nr:1-acyl-sn-glycerol-3-phosphate acyltransferase [Bacteroidales bacterium]